MNLSLKKYVPDPLTWQRYFKKEMADRYKNSGQRGGGGGMGMVTMDQMDGYYTPPTRSDVLQLTLVSPAEQTVLQAKSQLVREAAAATSTAITQPKRRRRRKRIEQADIVQIPKVQQSGGKKKVTRRRRQTVKKRKQLSASKRDGFGPTREYVNRP
jgi:hypothetical protein